MERKHRNPIREGCWQRGRSTSDQQLSGAKENGKYRHQAAKHPNGIRGEKVRRQRIPNNTGPTLNRQRQQEPGAGAHNLIKAVAEQRRGSG